MHLHLTSEIKNRSITHPMAVLYHIECEVRCRQEIDGLETCETRARIKTGEKTAVIVSLQFKLE